MGVCECGRDLAGACDLGVVDRYQQHEIPLFDRLAIMRHWSDTGAFDLYATGKDNVLAQRVHDCIGRGIASMIIDAAHLPSVDTKAGQ